MVVVLKEQLELRPSVALQKKVGLKSLEQVIRWGDRVNQELRRLRKLEDRKCWRARARRIRKKSRSGSSGLSKAQALVKLEAQEREYQREVEKVWKWWLEALEEAEVIIQLEGQTEKCGKEETVERIDGPGGAHLSQSGDPSRKGGGADAKSSIVLS